MWREKIWWFFGAKKFLALKADYQRTEQHLKYWKQQGQVWQREHDKLMARCHHCYAHGVGVGKLFALRELVLKEDMPCPDTVDTKIHHQAILTILERVDELIAGLGEEDISCDV